MISFHSYQTSYGVHTTSVDLVSKLNSHQTVLALTLSVMSANNQSVLNANLLIMRSNLAKNIKEKGQENKNFSDLGTITKRIVPNVEYL